MKPKQRKPVHFIFKTHGKNDATRLGGHIKTARTFVIEMAHGHPKGKPFDVYRGSNRKSRTIFRVLKKAGKAGKNIAAGETTITDEEKQKLTELIRTEEQKLIKLIRTEKGDERAFLETGKQYFAARLATDKFRHQLIRRTIIRSPKPLVAEYGTGHSLLSGELQRKGIPSSREMPPQVFSPSAVVSRKLLVGKNPSDLDYKMGIIDIMLRPLMGRDNDKSSREEALARSVLIRNLSENQLNEILLTRNERLILTFNGLPANSTFGQIRQFVKTHSAFWKHERRVRRLQNKAKKQKWKRKS